MRYERTYTRHKGSYGVHTAVATRNGMPLTRKHNEGGNIKFKVEQSSLGQRRVEHIQRSGNKNEEKGSKVENTGNVL